MRRASAMQGQACTELKTKRERKGDEGPDEGRQAVRLTSSADSPSPTLGGLALPHYIPTGNRASTSVANHHQSAGVKQYVKRFVKQYVQQMLNQSSVSSSTWYLIYPSEGGGANGLSFSLCASGGVRGARCRKGLGLGSRVCLFVCLSVCLFVCPGPGWRFLLSEGVGRSRNFGARTCGMVLESRDLHFGVRDLVSFFDFGRVDPAQTEKP